MPAGAARHEHRETRRVGREVGGGHDLLVGLDPLLDLIGHEVFAVAVVVGQVEGLPDVALAQVFSPQILAIMRSLDTPEVHGYRADVGYRVYVDKALEIAAITRPALPPEVAGPAGPAA